MQTHIAILRGINVGGKRKILIADLRNMLSELGFSNVNTYAQSGNVVFEYKSHKNSELATKITNQIHDKYGFDVPVIVITTAEFAEDFRSNPFVEKAEIGQLHLTFLSEEPTDEKLTGINLLAHPPDEFRIIGKGVYLKCVNKYHQTKLSNNFFEKKLGVFATTRNWETVTKLVEMTKG
ncbi:MAG: hypothetical protein ACI9V1_000410 [Spirosomataceae bacterium]|jgi:uncharacterized protein (DUF1697 family)